MLLIQSSVKACDVCGCGGGIGMGLLTDYKTNFIRVGYFNSHFETSTDYGYKVSDQFHRMEISSRYAIGDRLRVTAVLPILSNIRNSEAETELITHSGIGDARIGLNYKLINTSFSCDQNLYIEAGIGTNIPTGDYIENLHDLDIPANFNLGKGAIGGLFEANAVYTKARFGLVQSSVFQVNSQSKGGYQFGNQLNMQLIAFREFAISKYFLIPNLGVIYEQTSKDKYANDESVHGTGGQGLFLSSALNFKSNKWLAGIGYSLPIAGTYSDGEATPKGRVSCQLTYIF